MARLPMQHLSSYPLLYGTMRSVLSLCMSYLLLTLPTPQNWLQPDVACPPDLTLSTPKVNIFLPKSWLSTLELISTHRIDFVHPRVDCVHPRVYIPPTVFTLSTPRADFLPIEFTLSTPRVDFLPTEFTLSTPQRWLPTHRVHFGHLQRWLSTPEFTLFTPEFTFYPQSWLCPPTELASYPLTWCCPPTTELTLPTLKVNFGGEVQEEEDDFLNCGSSDAVNSWVCVRHCHRFSPGLLGWQKGLGDQCSVRVLYRCLWT